MNIVLLITVTLALTLVHGNDQPCLRNLNNNAYNTFVRRHILRKTFNRTSLTDWESYIKDQKLCDRPTQSFLESSDQRNVEQICDGKGRPMLNSNQGNLCISDRNMLVYKLRVRNNCKVRMVKGRQPVIVACDVVENHCRPVHFEKYTNQTADKKAKPCKATSLEGL